MGMAVIRDVIAPLFGGAHEENQGMVEMAEIPETLEIFELEMYVSPEMLETTGILENYETPVTSGILEIYGTPVMLETCVTPGILCMIDIGM